MPSLIETEGIGISNVKRLMNQGIKTSQALLAQGYTRKRREELAKATGLSKKTILELVTKADILQIHGIGPEYASLLNSVGVDTPTELASHDPEKLATRLAKVNQKKKLVRKLPAREQVKDWILDAIAIRSAPHGLGDEPGTDAPAPKKKRYYVRY